MKKTGIVLLALTIVLALVGCGIKKKDDTGGGVPGVNNATIAGYYEIIYMDGDSMNEEDLKVFKDAGLTISLTINEDGTAVLDMLGEKKEMEYDLNKMRMKYDGGKMDIALGNDYIRLTEKGETISFGRAESSSGGSSSGTETQTTTAPVSGDDAVKFQLSGIDENLGFNVPCGLDAIILTDSGRLSLIPNGELAANEGGEIVVATDAIAADIFTYGNGGYRVVLFVRKDGTVSAVDPTEMIMNHKIVIKDKLGGLTDVVEIYEQQEADGTLVVARMQDGSTEILDPYF